MDNIFTPSKLLKKNRLRRAFEKQMYDSETKIADFIATAISLRTFL